MSTRQKSLWTPALVYMVIVNLYVDIYVAMVFD